MTKLQKKMSHWELKEAPHTHTLHNTSVWRIVPPPPISPPRSPHITPIKATPPPSSTSEPSSPTPPSVSGRYPWLVGPLGHHLDLPPPEQRVIKSHGSLHRVLVSELHIGKPLWMAIKLVAENCHPVNRATTMEMLFQILGCSSIVNIPNVDTAAV